MDYPIKGIPRLLKDHLLVIPTKRSKYATVTYEEYTSDICVFGFDI